MLVTPRGLKRRLFDGALEIKGVSSHPSQFAPNPALWIDGREFAHTHDNGIEIRLTRPEISKRRADLRADPRVDLSRSDWITVRVSRSPDLDFARELLEAAARANRRDRPAHLPDDAGLARRRRLHSGKTDDLG